MDKDSNSYVVVGLGDTHCDAEPESVYHSHYDESNRWAEIQHQEFRRNGEMWRTRCPRLLGASATLARDLGAAFLLQTGDVIQGDCDDAPTHRKMLGDCIGLLRKPYPAGLPFLTVLGNHDIRGKGAREVYLDFASEFIAREIAALPGAKPRRGGVAYPVFSFSFHGDLWIFCDFENNDLQPVIDAVESGGGARHVFLVTHGPFTTPDDGSFRWRLGGRREADGLRPRLYEALSRRHAIVISGHTHYTSYYRHSNSFGGFCEFTATSVWSRPELGEEGDVFTTVDGYGAFSMPKFEGERLEDFKSQLGFFRPGLREYYWSMAAGHFAIAISDTSVGVDFFAGDSVVATRHFEMI
ncbi:MAG: metallophosphoesterase [Kiritimatiellae bacterium]|nr:metallophosphoesterase [Kiritimatiellia bacterium]